MTKLTVAIPTYNRANYLKEAIQGILNQTFKDFKLIILDNGSSDNTYEVVKSFKDDRITYIKNEKNIGGIGNLNKAIEICETEYLIICHDDDIAESTLLEKEFNIIDNDPNVSLVASHVKLINENGEIIDDKSRNITKDKIINQKEYIKLNLLSETILPCPTVMLRTAILKDNNLRFREDVGPAADTYLWFELNLLQFKFYFIGESLYKYRIHSEQDSQKNALELWFKFYIMLKPFLVENGFEDIIPKVSHRFYVNIMNTLIEKYIFGSLTRDEFRLYVKKAKKLGIKKRFLVTNREIKIYFKLFLMRISRKLLIRILNVKRGNKK